MKYLQLQSTYNIVITKTSIVPFLILADLRVFVSFQLLEVDTTTKIVDYFTGISVKEWKDWMTGNNSQQKTKAISRQPVRVIIVSGESFIFNYLFVHSIYMFSLVLSFFFLHRHFSVSFLRIHVSILDNNNPNFFTYVGFVVTFLQLHWYKSCATSFFLLLLLIFHDQKWWHY